MNLYNVAVFVSGNGSNLQAIIDAQPNLDINIALVISNHAGVYALKRAEDAHIPYVVIPNKEPDFAQCLLDILEQYDIDLIVLAGYLAILPPEIISVYPKQIINIHPSLIPKYCGKGFYGLKVHEAILNAKEKETGATVHYVDSGIDTGEIILQQTVDVKEDDTPETLQARVLKVEHEILLKTIQKIIQNEGDKFKK